MAASFQHMYGGSVDADVASRPDSFVWRWVRPHLRSVLACDFSAPLGCDGAIASFVITGTPLQLCSGQSSAFSWVGPESLSVLNDFQIMSLSGACPTSSEIWKRQRKSEA